MRESVGRRIGNLSVRAKIIAVLLIGSTVSAVVGAAALVQTAYVADRGRSIYVDALLPNAELAKLREYVVKARFDVLSRANAKTPEAATQANADLLADEAVIDSATAQYSRVALNVSQRRDLITFTNAWAAYKDVRDNKMTPAFDAGDITAYERYRTTELIPLVNTILASLDSLSAQADSLAQGRLDEAQNAQASAREVVGVLLMAGLLLAVVLGTATAGVIVRPLRRIRDVLDAVATDDLTQTVDVDTTEELGQIATSLNTSIGNLRTMRDALVQQAEHDMLTGLPNRASLMQLLEQTLRTRSLDNRGNAVVFIDLDGFKAVNDTWGHTFGDELLIEVAERIRVSLRDGDAVARIGGDEFVVLCGDVDDRSVVQLVAQRIVDTLGETFSIGGREAHVTASIGIAFAEVNSTPGELLRQADLAMYEAKSRGKAQYSIFDEMPSIELHLGR